VQRARLTVTREEAGQLVADQQELISRYRRGPADVTAGSRTVVLGFLAYPELAPDEAHGGPDEPVATAVPSRRCCCQSNQVMVDLPSRGRSPSQMRHAAGRRPILSYGLQKRGSSAVHDDTQRGLRVLLDGANFH
jgi:hypothetical protein